jgi:hypothetical protein
MKGPDKSLLNASNRVEQKGPFKRYASSGQGVKKKEYYGGY